MYVGHSLYARRYVASYFSIFSLVSHISVVPLVVANRRGTVPFHELNAVPTVLPPRCYRMYCSALFRHSIACCLVRRAGLTLAARI